MKKNKTDQACFICSGCGKKECGDMYFKKDGSGPYCKNCFSK